MSNVNNRPHYHLHVVAGFMAIVMLNAALPISAQPWHDVYYEFDGVSFQSAVESDAGTLLLLGNQGTIARLNPVTNELTRLRGGAGLTGITCGAQYNGDTLFAFQSFGGTIFSTDQGVTWADIDVGFPDAVVSCLRRPDGSLLIVSNTYAALLHADRKRSVFDVSLEDVHLTKNGRLIGVDRIGRVLVLSENERDWEEVANIGEQPLGITSIGTTAWILTHRALFSAEINEGSWTFSKTDYAAYATGDITCVSDTLVISRNNGLSIYQFLSADSGATWFGGWTGPDNYGDHRFAELRSGLMMVGPYGMYRYAEHGKLYDSTKFSRSGIGVGRRPVLQKSFSHLAHGASGAWYAVYRSPGYGLMRSKGSGDWETIMRHDSAVIERYQDLETVGDSVCVLVKSEFSYQVDSTWQVGERWKVYLIDENGQSVVVQSDSMLESAKGIAVSGRYLFIYDGRKLLRLRLTDLLLDTLSVDDPGYIRSMHANNRGRTAYVGRRIGISDDGGATWSYIDHPVGEGAGGSIHVTNGGRLYMARSFVDGTERGIKVYTTDPPYTEWTTTIAMPAVPGMVEPYSIDANESGVIAIASRSGRVAISTDSGSTWEVSRPYPESFVELPAVVVTENGTIRVAGSPSHIIETSRTVAGVQEWFEKQVQSCEAQWRNGSIAVASVASVDAQFMVVDLSGRTVARGLVESTETGSLCRISQQLAPGIYSVGIGNGNERTWCKMLVVE